MEKKCAINEIPRSLLVILGSFRNSTQTSLDNGTPSTNIQIWSNWNRIRSIPSTPSSSSDVPVLLLNQPIV